jgi:hypothetical protein
VEARRTIVGEVTKDARSQLAAGETLPVRPRLPWLAAMVGAVAVAVTVAIVLPAIDGSGNEASQPSTQVPTSAGQPVGSQEIVVYVVDGQEQAAQVRDAVLPLRTVIGSEPSLPLQAEFVVAGTEEAASTLEAYREVNEIRAAQGEMPILIVDLSH